MSYLIHTPTPSLAQSLDFYQRLGFTRIPDLPFVCVTDGKCLIEINPDRFARAGIKLIGPEWQEYIPSLREKTMMVELSGGGSLFADPNGVRIYLDPKPQSLPDPASYPQSTLGNYAGISLECMDLAQSVAFWEQLGLEITMGRAEQGWIALLHATGLGVSLMKPQTCPHLFFNPSLTYFNGGNNLEVIAHIREAGVPITEEVTVFNDQQMVDNVILRDPGGYGFFVFND